jgi:hypothetical protein
METVVVASFFPLTSAGINHIKILSCNLNGFISARENRTGQ